MLMLSELHLKIVTHTYVYTYLAVGHEMWQKQYQLTNIYLFCMSWQFVINIITINLLTLITSRIAEWNCQQFKFENCLLNNVKNNCVVTKYGLASPFNCHFPRLDLLTVITAMWICLFSLYIYTRILYIYIGRLLCENN